MSLRASDIVPISEARARLTGLAEDVVGSGSEKVLITNGRSYVALVDARRLDSYHPLEAEPASPVLAEDAITGLRQALAGQFVLRRGTGPGTASHRRRGAFQARQRFGWSELSGGPARCT